MQDPDDFRTTDSENEGSTDVSNPYRNIRCTDMVSQPTEPDADPEAAEEEKGHTSAFMTPSPTATRAPIHCPRFRTPHPIPLKPQTLSQ